MFAWRRRDVAAYAAAVAAGAHHQGVIVFPSGDIVVRMHRFMFSVDRTLEAAYFSRAEVERGCSPGCTITDVLRLHYLGIDGRACVLSVSQADLRDPVRGIAEFLSEMKQKSTV